LVNLEADILGKYVEKLINFNRDRQSAPEELTAAFLVENGYL
jgi:riboflavin synthase